MQGRSLTTTLYQTVHGSRRSVDELADAIGIGPSSLYRAVLEGDSGCKFDVQWLLPLMQATDNYAALDLLCQRTDSVRVKLPRVRRWKRMDPRITNELQKTFADLISLLLAYFDAPDKDKRAALETDIHDLVGDLLAVRRALGNFEQMELAHE